MNSAEHLLRELDAISNRIGAATTIEELEPLVLAQESMLRRIAVIDPRELGPAAAASLQNALLASAGARNTLLAERKRVALEWREVSQLHAALTSITHCRPDHRRVSVEL